MPARQLVAILLFAIGLLPVPRLNAQATGNVRLISVQKIWNQAPHNAFTDLVRFQDRWYCVFREGRAHVSPDGALELSRRATARTGRVRHSSVPPRATCEMPGSVTPQGRLMLLGAGGAARQVAARRRR